MPAFGRVMATVRDYAAHAAAMEPARVPTPKASQEPAAKGESPAGSKPRLSWADNEKARFPSRGSSPRRSASEQTSSQQSPPLLSLPPQQQPQESKPKTEDTPSELLAQELGSTPQQGQQQEDQPLVQTEVGVEPVGAECEDLIRSQDGNTEGDATVSAAADKAEKGMEKCDLVKDFETKEANRARMEMPNDEVEDKPLTSRADVPCGDSQAVLCGETQNVLCGETPLPIDEALSQPATFPRPAAPVQKKQKHLARDSAAAAHDSTSNALQSKPITESCLLESQARDVDFEFRAIKAISGAAQAVDDSKHILCNDSQVVLCGETQNVLCGETPMLVDEALSQPATFPRPAAPVQKEQKRLGGDTAAAAHDLKRNALESQQFPESELLESQVQDIGGTLPAKKAINGSFATFDADVLFDTQDRFLAVNETQAVTQDTGALETISDSSVASALHRGNSIVASNDGGNMIINSKKVAGQIVAINRGAEAEEEAMSAEEEEEEEEETCDPVHRAMAQFMATGVLDDGTCEPHSVAESGCHDMNDGNVGGADFKKNSDDKVGNMAKAENDNLAEYLPKQRAKDTIAEKEVADGAEIATTAAESVAPNADCLEGDHPSSPHDRAKSAVSTSSLQQAALDSVPQHHTHEQREGTFGSYSAATCDDSMTIPNTQQVEAMARAMSDGRKRGSHAAEQASIHSKDAKGGRPHDDGDDADDLSEEEEGHSPPLFSRPSHPVRALPRPTTALAPTATAAQDDCDDDDDEVEEEDESQQILFSLPHTRPPHKKPQQTQPQAQQVPQQMRSLNRWRSPQASVQDSLDEPSGLASPPVPWAMAKGHRQFNKGHTGAQQYLERQLSATSTAPLASSRNSTGSGSIPAAATGEAEAALDEDFDADAAAATFSRSRHRGFKSSSMSDGGVRGRASLGECSDGGEGRTSPEKRLPGRPSGGLLGRPSVATTAEYATSPGDSDGGMETPRTTRHGARDSNADSSTKTQDIDLARERTITSSSRDGQPRSGQAKKRPLEDLSAAACNSR